MVVPQLVAMETVDYSKIQIWHEEGPEVITDFQEEVAEVSESPIKIVSLLLMEGIRGEEVSSLGTEQTSFNSRFLRLLLLRKLTINNRILREAIAATPQVLTFPCLKMPLKVRMLESDRWINE